MKAIILCAGYATRLYPLTEKYPKPLLEIAGKPMIDRILEKLEEVDEITDAYIITNAKFKDQFQTWNKAYKSRLNVKVLNDDSTSNEDRLGAIRDLNLVIKEEGLTDDLLVVAGDNLFSFSIQTFVDFAHQHYPEVVIGAVDVKEKALATQYGILELDAEGRVKQFVEKPSDPPSTLASMGFYFIPGEKINCIEQFLEDDGNADAPGYFIQWLLDREPIRGFGFEGISLSSS